MDQEASRNEDVGVYIHVPFCARVCPYCDFAVEPAPELLTDPQSAEFRAREDRTVAALLTELEARRGAFADRSLATLYFGGGTPGLLQADSLARLGEAVRASFLPAKGEVEVTLEINPSTIERSRLADFAQHAGVNRVSVGVQSFEDSILKALGRAHCAEEITLTLEAARAAGFQNLSLDLMFAALHQTGSMLERDLQAAIDFGPEHISTYELVHEPGTPFGRAAEAGRLRPFDEDQAADMMLRVESALSAAGYERYELTNFARPGRASRHNQRYWRREPVLAIGPGAHSTDPPAPGRPFGARVGNERNWTQWMKRVEAGDSVDSDSEEILEAEQARFEAFFLGLRTRTGLSAGAFEREFGASPRSLHGDRIERLVGDGLLEESAGGDLALTARGRLLADEVAAEFVPESADLR